MAEIIKLNGLKLVDEGFEFETATADPPVEAVEAEPGEAPEGAPSQRTTSHKPEDVSPDEWERRQDAVRSLAREFDDLDHGDIREFLVGRTQRELTDDEVGQLRHDVIAHRVRDITDVLDEQLRSTSERLKRARRTVRVQAPRGWMQRAFSSLDERAVGQVAARLLQRGHDPETVKEKVLSRVKDEETRMRLVEAIDKDELKVEFATGGLLYHDHTGSFSQDFSGPFPQAMMDFALNMSESIAQNVKVPDINIEVPVSIGKTSKKVKRNADTGLIEEIIEEPDA